MASQGSPQGYRSPLVKQDPHSDRDCSRALGGVFQNQPCLLHGHAGEQVDELRQGDTVFKVLEQSRHRDAGAAKHLGATYQQWVPFHGSTVRPTEIGLYWHGRAGRKTPSA